MEGTIDASTSLSLPHDETAARRDGRGIDWNALFFHGLIVALLIPLWSFRLFPSQDGPFHMYVAVVTHDYDRPDRPRLHEFFEKNSRLVPNWLGPHVLPILVGVFPTEIAEKILLSAYVILFPLAVRYALRSIRPRAGCLAIVVIPFVPNIYYHLGFLDFCLGLPVFFFAIGYWLRHRRHFGARQAVALAAILLLGYLCHLVPTAMAGLFLIVLALTMGGGDIRMRVRRLMPVIAAGAPVALLTIWFLLSQRSEPKMPGVVYSGLSRLSELVRFQKAFAKPEAALAAVNLALFAGVSIWLLWRRRGRRLIIGLDAFLLIACVCGALFLVAPDAGSGGAMLVVRLAIFPLLALLLWWAAQPIGSQAFRRLRLTTTTLSTVLSLLLLASISVSYARVTPYLQDMETAVLACAPNSTLMLASYRPYATIGPDGQQIVRGPDVFLQGGYRQAAERGIVIVTCMPATTNYHPIRFRPGLSPGYGELIDFTAHARRIGKPIDYVLLWTGGGTADGPPASIIRKQLEDGYDLIFTSPQTGDAKLYRRKNWMPPRSAPSWGATR